jgi:hypothetical protein
VKVSEILHEGRLTAFIERQREVLRILRQGDKMATLPLSLPNCLSSHRPARVTMAPL